MQVTHQQVSTGPFISCELRQITGRRVRSKTQDERDVTMRRRCPYVQTGKKNNASTLRVTDQHNHPAEDKNPLKPHCGEQQHVLMIALFSSKRKSYCNWVQDSFLLREKDN